MNPCCCDPCKIIDEYAIVQLNTNSIGDDGFDVYLGGTTFIGSGTRIGSSNLSTNTCRAAAYVTNSDLDPTTFGLFCNLDILGAPAHTDPDYDIVTFDKSLIHKGDNVMTWKNVIDNGLGNRGNCYVIPFHTKSDGTFKQCPPLLVAEYAGFPGTNFVFHFTVKHI